MNDIIIEKIKLDLTKEQLAAINSTLVEHCCGLVELLITAQDEQTFTKAQKILQASTAAQAEIFNYASGISEELPKHIALLIRPVLEGSIEQIQQIESKENVLLAAALDKKVKLLEEILTKLPEPSAIITP